MYKHKLTQTHSPKEEDRSKITSESDHLTYGSDSQTAEGSSPYRRSNCDGISPYRNEPSQSPFYEGKGFLGVPQREKKNSTDDGSESFEKHRDDNWVITPTRASLQGSGSMSPSVDRILHVSCKQMMLDTPHSKSSSIDTSSENKGTVQSADEDSEVGVESRRIKESLLGETCRKDALPTKLTELDMKFSPERSVCVVTDENYGLKHHDGALPLKEEDQVKNNADILQSLLPPPLPNSPSESWLSRALPSVSSKNSSTQSFLGMQIHPKKQAINASPTDVKLIASAKPPRPQRGPTRFADMLEKPQSPQSEI